MQTNRFTGFALAAIIAAFALTILFWLPLWQGGGLIGGDLYSYYFPQKVFFAEAIYSGEFPLWNNRTGHGYPLVGESQTGPFYPFHLVFYTVLSPNAAYNANHLLHYILAFVFTLAYARRFGLTFASASLAAIVYTYGWFPARTCVEWAIIGGAWLPAALWCVEGFLQTRLWRWAIALSFVLALQLLAGHFQFAWITLLTLAAYIPCRLWLASDERIDFAAGAEQYRELNQRTGVSRWPGPVPTTRRRLLLVLIVVGLFGGGLAAIQLIPTWELKQRSQRVEVGECHQLSFGAIPPWYWSQMVAPWYWYSPLVNRDEALTKAPAVAGVLTNQVEAHLYFGLVPLALAVWSILGALIDRDRKRLFWLAWGLIVLSYTSGWLTPIVSHVPGFSFFQGPGRYGVVTTLAVALLAGYGLEGVSKPKRLASWGGAWCLVALIVASLSSTKLAGDADFITAEWHAAPLFALGSFVLSGNGMTLLTLVIVVAGVLGVVLTWRAHRSDRRMARQEPQSSIVNAGRIAILIAIFTSTVVDLWQVSRLVTFSPMIENPPISHLDTSELRHVLATAQQPIRLQAPGANLPTVLGVASTPVYLTFGPAEYVNPQFSLPPRAANTAGYSPSQYDWMRRAGVTHILSFKRLDPDSSTLRLLWTGQDRVLNRAWARFEEPLYLYELLGTRGRVCWKEGTPPSTQPPQVVSYHSNEVIITANSPRGGRLILTDLAYPGWEVTIDGQPALPQVEDGMYRAVDVPAGSHQIAWRYRPRSLRIGAAISLISLILLAAIAHVRFWHPTWQFRH